MNNIKRKIKKLVRDPKLFFKDMYQKRVIHLKQKRIIKHKANNQYTIVSAVYNVASYLDEYFISITKQTLSFKNHIHIILVDDGSTDNSAEIIEKWQKKYPQNIHYIYKENGGQASARNLGLENVKTDWVTFIDPDDFISADYFHKIDLFLDKHDHISMVGCPLILYFEDQNVYKDTHPLKYRFAKGNVILPLSNLKDHLQLSASTAIFKTGYIKDQGILFDEEMKPSFEDAKFVTDYILKTDQKTKAGFISDISYFYRKRSDGSSTLDGAWKNPLLFSRVIEKGCIEILKTAQRKFGVVPEHIQRIALYHIIWYFGRIVNNPAALSHLSQEQKENFVELLHQMFTYIDERTIERFNLAGTWFFQKVALLGLFKGKKPSQQIAYVEDFDLKKNQVLIKYFSNFQPLEHWVINNKEVYPSYQKEMPYDFLGRLYTKEYRTWVKCPENGNLEFFLHNQKVKLTFLGKQFEKLPISTIKQHYSKVSTVKEDVWILMDRDNQADDNAEHLYRYIRQNHPQHEIYFALNKSSSDWKRLEKEGFNLLEFGSKTFEKKLRDCSKIISSHIDGYITHYFKDNSLLDKDYVFLQHGITKDDLSSWLNTKKVSLFVTATHDEYHSIADNNTLYKFSKKEVQLTGFPRYDKLLSGNKTNNQQILIMPTWRNSIVGSYIKGTERARNSAFMQSNYARHWHSFMNHDVLKQLNQRGYDIIFAPHPSIQEYMDEFTMPNFVKVYSYSVGNIQALFQSTSILITDYSSVAFDVAYLNKAILYYQFDHDEVFSGNHTYRKGYFDYERDGFGAVSYTEEELLEQLEKLINNGGKLLECYKERIHKTFAFRDNNNCKRVYQAIVNLDNYETIDDISIAQKMLTQAENHAEWKLAAKHAFHLLQSKKQENKKRSEYEQRYLNALFKAQDFITLLNYINLNKVKNMIYWQEKINLKIGNEKQAVKYFAENNIGSQEDRLIAILAAALNKDLHSVEILNLNLVSELSLDYNSLLFLAKKISQQEYFIALSVIEDLLEKLSNKDKNIFKLELVASYICMRLNNLQQAHKYLVRYESHSKNDPSCRIAIARLAKLRNDDEKLFTQMNRAFEDNLLLMPEDLVPSYLRALAQHKNTVAEETLLAQFLEKYPNSKTIALYQAEKLYQAHQWQELVDGLEKYIQISERAMYLYTFALCRLNKSKQAQEVFNALPKSNSFNYWKLAAEIAEVNNDKLMLKTCLENQLNSIS